MATRHRGGPPGAGSARRLRLDEARFYASVYSSARRGSLGELRRRGCSEEEAEECFAMALEKVMERVDPIEREFSEAQMVSFIKQTCWRCFLDSHRRPRQLPLTELAAGEADGEDTPGPDQIAQSREAVAIGREALQMLPERDRLVFRQRYEMGLSPEEIVRGCGLSERTYRKIIQRANARVLDAFERIEAGVRCEEMESDVLRRYVAGECGERELGSVKAHLAHCRACRRHEARMRGYLLDVASGLGAALSVATARSGGVSTSALERALEGAQGLGEATRAARERLREQLLRLAGALPGPGGESGVSGALGVGSAKVASVCVAGAAGACLVAGVVPGVGGIGILAESDHVQAHRRPAHRAHGSTAPPSLIDTLPTPQPSSPTGSHGSSASGKRRGGESASSAKPAPTVSSAEMQSVPVSPSSAVESDARTGTEFSSPGEPVSPTRSTSPSASSQGSGGSSTGRGFADGAESGEFGP